MGKNRERYAYKIEYASGMFKEKNRDAAEIYSDTKLGMNEFIVVEHDGCGIFIGKVIEDITEDFFEGDIECLGHHGAYRYVQRIDMTKYLEDKAKEARKAELEEQMRERFAIIDEKKKFEYYASLDEGMKAMYEEYKELGDYFESN